LDETRSRPVNLSGIARRFGLRLVVQFGSTVTGRQWAESDFDVAVWTRVPRRQRTLAWYGELGSALEAALRPARELDLAVLDGGDSLLLFRVATHGRVLWGEDESVWGEFRSYAVRRYDDDAPRRAVLHRWLEVQLG
jgi:predicted nucleotidyltransferase